MLDIQFIRENPEKVKKATADKQLDPAIVDKVLELDEKRRKLIADTEQLRAKRNEIAKEGKVSEEGKKIKEALKKKEPELARVGEDLKEMLWTVPNLVAGDVPVGRNETENKVIRRWGEILKFDFKIKDHLELGRLLDIIDMETASSVAGARFTYLKGDAVLLQNALFQFALSVLTNRSILEKIAKQARVKFVGSVFVPVMPPLIIKPEIYNKMARLYPKEERYYIPSDDIFLIGSAEHTLGPLHMNETLSETDLPRRYFALTSCFRREAGSYGKDTKGILRVHQFDKIEMESFTLPQDSLQEQNFIIAIQEYLMQELNIPYQVVAICTGDMSKPDYRQIDIEAWLPGQDKYRETHTADLMTDYQARRLETRVRRNDRKTEFIHMNDATVFAIGRTIIAILENYQQKDGSVVVPKVLRKWVGKDRIVSSR